MKARLFAVVFIGVFLAPQTHAKTFYLLVDTAPSAAQVGPLSQQHGSGGGSVDSTSYGSNAKSTPNNPAEFYNDLRLGYEVLRARGVNPIVLAKDGKWRIAERTGRSNLSLTEAGRLSADANSLEVPLYPPIDAPFRGPADLRSALQGLHAAPGDQIFVELVGHGFEAIAGKPGYGPPVTDTDLMTGGIYAWDQRILISEMADVFNELPGVGFKLTTNTCYSGAFQALARKLANFCASTPTKYFKMFSTNYESTAPYDQAFWDRVRHEPSDAKVSLSEAGQAGFSGDINNIGNGQLSSSDYVDYVLKRGVYSNFSKWTTVGGPRSFVGALLMDESEPSLELLEGYNCSLRFQAGPGIDLRAIEQILLALMGDSTTQTAFHAAIADLRKNGETYRNQLEQFQSQYMALKGRWEAYENRNKGKNPWEKEGPERATLTSQVKDLMNTVNRTLARYTQDIQQLNLLKSYEEFSKSASLEQKRKFVSFVKCESEPIL